MGVGVFVAVLAAATGATSSSAPLLVLAAATGALAVAVAMRASSLPFAAALLTLSYLPEEIGTGGIFSHPELQKGILLFGAATLMIAFGVRSRFLLPLFAYLTLALLAIAHSHLTPGLGYAQMASSFLTLTLAWVVLSIAWRWERDIAFLKIAAAIPALSVVVGLVLQVFGLHELWTLSGGDVFPRLQGASIPPQLAMSAFMGSVISYICARERAWALAPYFMIGNGVILILTVSRGAFIAFVIAFAWPAARFGFGSVAQRPRTGLLRLAVVAAVLVALVAVVVPLLGSRESRPATYVGQTSTTRDPTSGRQKAWEQFFAVGEESPLFGHGLGSGPITKIQQEGFRAQHNEYLRMFLEGGYIGGGLVLLAIFVSVIYAIRLAPARLRADLAGVGVAVAILSATDNTLNSPEHAIPLGLLLGMCASRTRARPASAAGPNPEGDG